MKIPVTTEMITTGRRWHSSCCPLALSFEALGFDVMIGPDNVDFYNRAGYVFSAPLPPRAQSFKKLFDAGEKPAAFEFEMPGIAIRPQSSVISPLNSK